MSDVADNEPIVGAEAIAEDIEAQMQGVRSAPTPNTDRRKCLCCDQWHTFAESAPTPNTDRPDALHSPTYKERFQAARRRAQAAEQEVERLREALREVEWMGAAYRDDCERCPGCGRCRPRHEDDCILARALVGDKDV